MNRSNPMNVRRAAVALAVASLGLAACGDRDRSADASGGRTATNNSASTGATTASAPSSSVTSTSNSTTIAAADRNFILTAASNDMLEVEASRLALDRTQNAAVRTFAQHMVDEHTKTTDKLRSIASNAGFNETLAMNSMHSADLERLRALNGAEFDREYAAQIGVAAHQMAVAQFEAAERDLGDAQLKRFASETLPHLREHLQQAQAMATSVGVPGDRLKVANAAGVRGAADPSATGTTSASGATSGGSPATGSTPTPSGTTGRSGSGS
jgi:putative membrane protein